MQFNQWIITTGVMTYITASLSRRHQIAFSHLPVPHLNFQIAFGNSQHVVVVLLFVFFSLDVSSYVLQDSPSCVLLWHSTSCLWLLPSPPPIHLFCIWACVSPLFFVSFSVFCLVLVCLCLLLMCHVFFKLLSSATVWFALSFVFCFFSFLFFFSWILFYLTFCCQPFFFFFCHLLCLPFLFWGSLDALSIKLTFYFLTCLPLYVHLGSQLFFTQKTVTFIFGLFLQTHVKWFLLLGVNQTKGRK